jgi:hypothetical protein
VQAKYPSFVLAPQSPSGSSVVDFPRVLELLDAVKSE